MKKILLFFFLTALGGYAVAQESPIGEVTTDDLTMQTYRGDTGAHAVVLKEHGSARINIGQQSQVILEYNVRIKIIDSKGFKEANVIVPVYKSSRDRFEYVEMITGTTSYVDENGKIIKTNLDAKSVIKENKNSHWDHVKFTMPDVRAGCVIEYRYKLTSPFIFNFRTWEFQSDIPKIQSQYVTNIPGVYQYNISYKGPFKLKTGIPQLINECFVASSGLKANCLKMTYTLDSIPAFVEEVYMTAASNFRSSINFELSEYYDASGIKHPVTKNWKNIDSELMSEDTFGKQLQKKDLFAAEIRNLISTETDELVKAKIIFKHIQKWFKWDGVMGFYASGLRKAYEKRSGNIADINLSLVSAMTSAGIFCEPVLLSTRANGIVNKLYPVISEFNYVIARIEIGDKSYLLDASETFLPFGLLPVHCINDQGRVMSLTRPSFWIDLNASQKASESYNFNLVLDETGKMKGTLSAFSGGYEAHNKRMAIKKFNSIEEYVEDLDERYPNIRILKSEIVNIDSLESVLSEIYEIEVDAFDDLSQAKLLYNPFFMIKVVENPFKLAERYYPVDWGAPNETRFTLMLTIPDKFKVVSSPTVTRVAMPQNGGFFMTSQAIDGNVITFSQMTQFSKSLYTPEEYPYLKEIFNRIVAVHKTDFVFQKNP